MSQTRTACRLDTDRTEWVDDVSKWPSVDYGYIYTEFINTPGMYTAEALKSFRSHDSYAPYLAAHVQTSCGVSCMHVYRTCYCWHFKYPITFVDIDLNILSCLIFIHKNYVLFCRYLFIYLCECLVCVSHVNSVIISFRFLWSTLLIYYV